MLFFKKNWESVWDPYHQKLSHHLCDVGSDIVCEIFTISGDLMDRIYWLIKGIVDALKESGISTRKLEKNLGSYNEAQYRSTIKHLISAAIIELLYSDKDNKIFKEVTLTEKQLENEIFKLCGYNDSEARFHEELKNRTRGLEKSSRYDLHCNLLLERFQLPTDNLHIMSVAPLFSNYLDYLISDFHDAFKKRGKYWELSYIKRKSQ